MINTTYIYFLHKGDNIPFYIGKTNNPITRLKNHKKTKNNSSLLLEIIEEVDIIKWKFWESYWISQFLTWGFELENKNGGGGGNSYLKESSKDLIRVKLKARKYLPEWGEKCSIVSRGKSKNMPSNYGEIISKAKKGIPNPKLSKSRTGQPHPKSSKFILQLDLNGVIIKEWESSKEASQVLKINSNNIRACARKEQKSCGGFIWKYKF